MKTYALLAVALSVLAPQASAQTLAIQTPQTFREACRTVDLNSAPFRECLTFFTGYISGYTADRTGKSICVPPTVTPIQAFDRFREELYKPSGADMALEKTKDYDVTMATFLALKRAYPC